MVTNAIDCIRLNSHVFSRSDLFFGRFHVNFILLDFIRRVILHLLVIGWSAS